jgi:hypothetical protein
MPSQRMSSRMVAKIVQASLFWLNVFPPEDGVSDTLIWMSSRMVVKMVQASLFWLNMFPSEDGVSDTLSPYKIVEGSTIGSNEHCKLM